MLMGGVFLFMAMAIVVLCLRVHNLQESRSTAVDSHRKNLQKISRLVLQSGTQGHPVFKLHHAVEARVLMEEVLEHYPAGTGMAETQMRLPRGHVATLQSSAIAQEQEALAPFMDQLKTQYPNYDMPVLNKLAGLEAPDIDENLGRTEASATAG